VHASRVCRRRGRHGPWRRAGAGVGGWGLWAASAAAAACAHRRGPSRHCRTGRRAVACGRAHSASCRRAGCVLRPRASHQAWYCSRRPASRRGGPGVARDARAARGHQGGGEAGKGGGARRAVATRRRIGAGASEAAARARRIWAMCRTGSGRTRAATARPGTGAARRSGASRRRSQPTATWPRSPPRARPCDRSCRRPDARSRRASWRRTAGRQEGGRAWIE
jgi:hypothetical protein